MDGAETGWTDIGYHFLIGHDGKIYQGRPETVVGAHASPNTNAVGICCLGNYDPGADQVTPAMEKALVDLLSWLSATYEIDPRTQYFGHRDFSTKSCPGDMVYQRLPEYREQVLKNIVGKK
jgi:N-acetyl-anhydromuramyl-L-alanine amidase AmpD